jgi:hypothetical protein
MIEKIKKILEKIVTIEIAIAMVLSLIYLIKIIILKLI